MFVLNEDSKGSGALPRNSNLLNYSVLQSYYNAMPYRSFSIKYVVEGSELYSVHEKKYVVKNRQYLLANAYSEGYVKVDSERPVTGICIDISPSIISEAVGSFLRPDTLVADKGLDRLLSTPHFIENCYSADTTQVGKSLQQLSQVMKENPSNKLASNKEFYYLLAERIVQDQLPLLIQMNNIKSVSLATKKTLYNKVLRAKQLIDEHYHTPLSTDLLAEHCAMSEFHFYRVFKAAFSISPHQYLLQVRLLKAKELAHQVESVTQLALLCGFTDIYGFSKAYKKFFGHSPGYKCN